MCRYTSGLARTNGFISNLKNSARGHERRLGTCINRETIKLANYKNDVRRHLKGA